MVALLKVAVLNSCTAATAAQVQDWVKACEIQMNRDYFRAAVKAGVVSVKYYGKGAVAPLDAWWIAVIDDADMADALGYHDLTVAGLPIGKVFVKTAISYGERPSVTLSHELLEMLGDPYVNVVVADGLNIRRYWAKEVCDAVEAFSYPITLPATLTKPARTVEVSDFVLDNYWNTVPTKRPYSFKDNLTGPVPALAKGGYMAFEENGVWDQVVKFQSPPPTANQVPTPTHAIEFLRKRLDSNLDLRRAKRRIARNSLIRSTAKKVG